MNINNNLAKIISTGLFFFFPLVLINSEKNNFYEAKKVIVLDPGHGNGNAVKGKYDPGAMYKGYTESEIVLEQAKKTKELLEEKGKYIVFLTRNNNLDTILCESRPKYANRINADLFISFHINYYRSWSVSGFEAFYRDKGSKKLAETVVKNFKKNLNSKNRGAKYGEKKVLKELNCPGILIESGFLSNYEDRKYLIDSIPDVEKAILESIEEYFIKISFPLLSSPFPTFSDVPLRNN